MNAQLADPGTLPPGNSWCALSEDEAFEASQGAFMQAAWLKKRAGDEPDQSKRRELLRRAYVALAIAQRLNALA